MFVCVCVQTHVCTYFCVVCVCVYVGGCLVVCVCVSLSVGCLFACLVGQFVIAFFCVGLLLA